MNTMRTEYFLFGWCRLVRLSLITVVSIIRLALLPVYSKGSRICKKVQLGNSYLMELKLLCERKNVKIPLGMFILASQECKALIPTYFVAIFF